MNIFVLDENPVLAAQYHCDKHVVKMITESAQLLCSTYYYTDEGKDVPYSLSHKNHPCSIWARESKENWLWLLSLGLCLYEEYRFRYGDRQHSAGKVLLWCYENQPTLKSKGITQRPLCMPDKYKFGRSAVLCYRRYYIGDKRKLFEWTKRDVPYWISRQEGLYIVRENGNGLLH